MKNRLAILKTLFEFTEVLVRFPVTVILLLGLVMNNMMQINRMRNDNYLIIILALSVGIFLSAVFQLTYERFIRNSVVKIVAMVISAATVLIYYWMIQEADRVTNVRTTVILFILLVLFLWIPSIKSDTTFNECFLASFKAFFTALFFSGIVFLGIALILQAINVLIIPLSSKAYAHAANITFLLYAPIHYLSLIPIYSVAKKLIQKEEALQPESAASQKNGTELVRPVMRRSSSQKERLYKATDMPKFLESLISYVIIPITAVFTIILSIYLIMNITGEFWTDNLMEPLLISYSITVIFVYLLSARLDHKLSRGFKRIFPKVLVPIVLFQTISSIMKISEAGVTYGRYYIILFGIYATVVGILFCFISVRRNGMIAPILIIFALISILPPVDAFTVSRNSQTGRLKNILTENGMLAGNVITPNPNLSVEDQKKIVSAIDYLERMNDTGEIAWLSDYSRSYNFEKTFGFQRYGYIQKEQGSLYLYLAHENMIDVSGYDFLRGTSISNQGGNQQEATFQKSGINYSLEYVRSGGNTELVLKNEETELIRFPMSDIFDRFNAFEQVNHSAEMSEEEAKFTAENEQAILTLTMRTININYWQEEINWYADAYILVRIKFNLYWRLFK